MTYQCPICGYDQLKKAPKDFSICGCCGTEFGADDVDQTSLELRNAWIAKDMPWFSNAVIKPREWNPYRQLIIAGFGSDLVSHPRFRRDSDYRCAINKAFSEVRMGKQLKVLRESRRKSLTQLQLGEKVQPAMKQSRISELETMNYSGWSISTIERLAKALGVGVKYSFASWGELVPEIEGGLTAEELWLPPFEDDSKLDEKRSRSAQGTDDWQIIASYVVQLSNQDNENVVPYTEFQGRQQKRASPAGVGEPATDDPLVRAARGR